MLVGNLNDNACQYHTHALLSPPSARVSGVRGVRGMAAHASRYALAARGTQHAQGAGAGRHPWTFVIYAHPEDAEALRAAAQLLHALTPATSDCVSMEVAEPSGQSEGCSIYFAQSKVVELLLGGERGGSGLRSELGHVLLQLCSPKGQLCFPKGLVSLDPFLTFYTPPLDVLVCARSVVCVCVCGGDLWTCGLMV